MVDPSFVLLYHPDVKNDLTRINAKLKERIKKAIETRLTTAPHLYGEPLRKTLKGYWKLRVGDYRVVFKIMENKVLILGIIHRKEVYDKIGKRTDYPPPVLHFSMPANTVSCKMQCHPCPPRI